MVTTSLRMPPVRVPFPIDRAMPAADGGIGCAVRRLVLKLSGQQSALGTCA